MCACIFLYHSWLVNILWLHDWLPYSAAYMLYNKTSRAKRCKTLSNRYGGYLQVPAQINPRIHCGNDGKEWGCIKTSQGLHQRGGAWKMYTTKFHKFHQSVCLVAWKPFYFEHYDLLIGSPAGLLKFRGTSCRAFSSIAINGSWWSCHPEHPCRGGVSTI